MSSSAHAIKFDRDVPLPKALESVIDQANRHHQSDRTLTLYAHRFALQRNYWLGIQNKTEFEKNLVTLIAQYVQYLPSLIDEFNRHCEKIGWHRVAEQSNHVLASFFEKLDNPLGQAGILGLLDKVYFSHRMIEELHDHMMCISGQPAIAWNMTSANLLVHQILGANYSARLDQTAIELAHKLITNAPAMQMAQAQKSQASAWPCFCEQHGVNLAF